MVIEIKDKEVIEKIKKMEKIYTETFGKKNYGFFGQIANTSKGVVLTIGSFTLEEGIELNKIISSRDNEKFDIQYSINNNQ